MRASALALVVALCLPSAAMAADDDEIAPFDRCGAIADAAQRLACFDAALAAARERAGKRQRRAAEEFGLSAPQRADRRPEPAAPQATAEPERVDSTLQEVFTDGAGKNVFLLANGQVWRETSGSTYKGIIRSGWAVEVTKGGVGGFRLRFPKRTGMFAVARVR